MSLPSFLLRALDFTKAKGEGLPQTMCGILAAAWLRSHPTQLSRRTWGFETAKGAIERRGPDGVDVFAPPRDPVVVCASVLRMRNCSQDEWRQPAVHSVTGCVLAWNGEWYYDDDNNSCDTRRVLELLSGACGGATCASEARKAAALALAKTVRGPYAFILWIPSIQSLVYGRDPFGRRSLLLRREEDAIYLASTTPSSDDEAVSWCEVSTKGLGAISLSEGELEQTSWPREPLLDVVGWPPTSTSDFEPSMERERAADRLLSVLSEAVRRRVSHAPGPIAILFSGGIDSAVLAALCDRHAPADEPIDLVNVAFGEKGRLDANKAPDRLAARAALLELQGINCEREWRLVEVAITSRSLEKTAKDVVRLAQPSDTHMDFNIAAALAHAARGDGMLYRPEDVGHASANNDAESLGQLRYGEEKSLDARATTEQILCGNIRTEKKRPCSNAAHPKCVRSMCGNCCRRSRDDACGTHPRWLSPDEKAAIQAIEAVHLHQQRQSSPALIESFEELDQNDFSSRGRVLLLGMGADELLAGYARHRTAWRRGGYDALNAELDLDVGRIATRNLGRDDRVVADTGKEARFPFLDEDVVALVRTELHLGDLADLDKPPGVGCKQVLRDVANSIGLSTCAKLQKRAIQFGTRIASHSNKLAFGSNRRADGATAFDIRTLETASNSP